MESFSRTLPVQTLARQRENFKLVGLKYSVYLGNKSLFWARFLEERTRD